MARQRKTRETVTLTSPQGTTVSVAKERVDHYKARGYKAQASRSAKKSDDE